jgi:hypothetical protein
VSDSGDKPRRWWQPRRFEWNALEMFVMRLSFAVLLFFNTRWDIKQYQTQEFPNGLAKLFDLTWLADSPPGVVFKGIAIAGLALYVVGWLPALGLLPMTVYAVLAGTLINSQGAINHSWQLVAMIAVAQLLVSLVPRSTPAGRDWRLLVRPDIERHRNLIWAALIVIAASYVVSAFVKLEASNGKWIFETPNLAVQIVKTNQAEYYNSLQMPPEWMQRTTQFLLEHPFVAMVVFGSGLLIELSGFVLLISRRWALIGAMAIIGLHLSISKLMKLDFEAHIAAVVIFALNVPGIVKALRGER